VFIGFWQGNRKSRERERERERERGLGIMQTLMGGQKYQPYYSGTSNYGHSN
jgi:hypothetical protein